MKRIILPILAALMLVLACGEGGSPEQVIDGFLQACKDEDKEAALATIYSGNVDSDIHEFFENYIWAAVESGEIVIDSWTDPKVVETEEVDEEGVDVKEVAWVESEVTIKEGGDSDTDTMEFEVVRTSAGWFIFEMD